MKSAFSNFLSLFGGERKLGFAFPAIFNSEYFAKGLNSNGRSIQENRKGRIEIEPQLNKYLVRCQI